MINTCSMNIDFEKETLDMHLSLQDGFKKNLLKYMDKLADSALELFKSSVGNTAYDYLNNVKVLLQKADDSIKKLSDLKRKLNNYRSNFTDAELNRFIASYNKDYSSDIRVVLQNNIEIQNMLNELSDYVSFLFPITENRKFSVSSKSDNSKGSSENKKESTDLKENVLVISDIKQSIILPYEISELESILKENNNYNSFEEIIDENYTIPISRYKNSAISRFREAYFLVRHRSSGSIIDAFDLGLELFFKYDLNPAIITACKNIDELDVYLSCLENNELDSFKCFNIVYESLPTLKN